MDGDYALVEVYFEFYHESTKLFSIETSNQIKGYDSNPLHDQNIRQAILKSLQAFDQSGWEEKLNAKTDYVMEPSNTKQERVPSYSYQDLESTVKKANTSLENKNIFAIGYQIGGYNLIGFDYEVRFHDYFGVHFGAGIYGFTGGLKIHTNPDKNSTFFNLSYKDLGFGGMSTTGAEIGGRLVFRNNGNFGFHYQAGLAYINYMHPDYLRL